ncbi:hypothetical protein PIB30_088959, partial [Stylosanthes scabra]|nr:hypothetical protein [Stylosanthes scabra]
MELIELVANNQYMFTSERSVKRGVMEIDTMDALLAQNKTITQQLSTLNKKMGKLEVAAMSNQVETTTTCGLCGDAHENQKCCLLRDETPLEKGSQSPKNNHFQNHPPYQPFQPSPFPQLITIPPPPQPKPPQANFEAALEFVQTTTTFVEEARTNFRNQESSIRNLETQVGKIATQLSTHLPNAFPSDTVVNPTVECYVITIGNGKAFQDSKHEGLNKGNVKGTPTKPLKEEM